MKIVVDTSILIDYLRDGTQWEDFLLTAPRNAELFLPTIVVFELFSGQSTKNVNVQKEIFELVEKFQKIDLTEKISKRAGELLRDMKFNLEVPDYIIAASAVEINGAVVTLNTKHFQKIPGLNLFPL